MRLRSMRFRVICGSAVRVFLYLGAASQMFGPYFVCNLLAGKSIVFLMTETSHMLCDRIASFNCFTERVRTLHCCMANWNRRINYYTKITYVRNKRYLFKHQVLSSSFEPLHDSCQSSDQLRTSDVRQYGFPLCATRKHTFSKSFFVGCW